MNDGVTVSVNYRDFVPVWMVSKFLSKHDTDLWLKFCNENSIIGITKVRKYLLSENLCMLLENRRLSNNVFMALSSLDNSVVLISTPIILDSEVEDACRVLGIENYVVLGKDRSFFEPGYSNLVVFRICDTV